MSVEIAQKPRIVIEWETDANFKMEIRNVAPLQAIIAAAELTRIAHNLRNMEQASAEMERANIAAMAQKISSDRNGR